jgi:hypothetical protein
MFQEVSVAKLVRDFYLGEGVDASMDNIHLTIDMFSDIVFWAGAHRYYQESLPSEDMTFVSTIFV